MAEVQGKLPEEIAVEEQANIVRTLKTAKAPKEQVDEAVAELKKRKAALAAVKPAEAPVAAAAAAAAAAEATPVAPAAVEDLSAYFASAVSVSNCPAGLTPEERFKLVSSVAEECIEAAELAYAPSCSESK
jgi:hypothetical protein